MSELTVVDRLKWITEEHLGNKKAALAKAMRCGKPYVSALYDGTRTNPSSELLENLLSSLRAARVNIRREWLIRGEGERYDTATIHEGHEPYRVNLHLDLSLIFKAQSVRQLADMLHQILLDESATPESKALNAEVVFTEILKRLRANSTAASAAEDLLDAAEEEIQRAPKLPHSPATGATSGQGAPQLRVVSPESTTPPAAPAPVPK